MANKEQKPSASENTNENHDGRRSFMKGIVAGTVAAGTIAATVTNATPAQAATNPLLAKPRPDTAKLKITFDQRRPPKLYEVQKSIEDLARRLGCDNCGLGGIDVLIRLDELINPADRYVAIVEGSVIG